MTTAADQPPAETNLSPHPPKLARTMGFWALVIYGVGDMLGAGVYGLVGKAAGIMGNAVWLAFAGAMIAAMLTGFSYACIGSRYPRAAGAAYVTHRAYRVAFLAYLVGLAVTASGLTSMAAGSRVIGGFIQTLGVQLPLEVIVLTVLALITFIVFRGMRESTWMNVICTSVEVSGLLIVIIVGLRYWGSVNYLETPPVPAGSPAGTIGGISVMLVLQGAVLTFYSFIGFEDILNVAEEVKEPRTTIPRGLILALIIATTIYMAVSITAVSVIPYSELKDSKAALVDVVRRAAPWFPPLVFTGISIFAVSNTVLLNFVMGSRMLYGMSNQGMLPRVIGKVHPARRTPHIAILVLMVIVMTLAVSGDIRQLADATSLLLLAVFVVVNIGLILLKLRPGEPRGAFEVPIFVPALGALVCLALISARVLGPGAEMKAPMIAGIMVLGIAVLYLVLRPKEVVAVTDDVIID